MTEVNDILKLKLFIEAAEMVGGDDWTPNPGQWKKIREKIMALPDALGNVHTVNAPQVVHPTAPIDHYQQPHLTPQPSIPAGQGSLFPQGNQAPHVPPQSVPLPLHSSTVMSQNPETPTKLAVNADGTVNTNAFS